VLAASMLLQARIQGESLYHLNLASILNKRLRQEETGSIFREPELP
jgi:hypothetical protein